MATLEHAPRIRFSCGACGAPFAVAPELAGRRAVCKRCRNPLVVPDGPAGPPPTPPAAPAVSAAVRPGVRRRLPRRFARLLWLVAAAGLAVAAMLIGVHLKGLQVQRTLARVIAQNEAAVAKLAPEAVVAWQSAASQTAELIAELEGLGAERGDESLDAMLRFLRRQDEFLQAKARLDRLQADVQAALAHYRRHIWHPPESSRQWPIYLEQTASLREGLQRRWHAIEAAAAETAGRHSELVKAEHAAVLRLVAAGFPMTAHFGDFAERFREVWSEAGGRASGALLEF